MKLLKSEKMGDYEKEHNRASYRTLVEYYIGDIVLCNNILDVDYNVINNIDISEDHEEIENFEIFQYYLCNLNTSDRELAKKSGLILSYSEVLDCDVLCVDHWGTSWDYVLTSVELVDTYEELKEEGF